MNAISRGFVRLLVMILFCVVIAGAFIAGGLAYKYDSYDQIPGISYVIPLLDPPFFYPAVDQGAPEPVHAEDVSSPFSFIVYGDSREIAVPVKTAIIDRIIEENPAFVLHLGDMVSCGNAQQWKIFDCFEGKFLREAIPLYPVLGNHEYRSIDEEYPEDPEEQLKHYFKRFQFLEQRRWYTFTYGPCTFVILDTATDFSEESPQFQWLEQELRDQSSGYLFVALHYPPHTKSDHGRRAEKRLAALFESTDPAHRNPDIVFGGHVHNYERYLYHGVNYVVSGGGGAPPRSVKRSSQDFYSKPGATFHYCKITVSESELRFEMMRINDATGKWGIGDEFTIRKGMKGKGD